MLGFEYNQLILTWGFFMAKKAKSSKVRSGAVLDAALADVEAEATRAAAAADKKRMAAKKDLSCTTCRYLKDARTPYAVCPKMRIEISLANPRPDCEYWRRPLPV